MRKSRILILEKIKSHSYCLVDGTKVYLNKFGREIKSRSKLRSIIIMGLDPAITDCDVMAIGQIVITYGGRMRINNGYELVKFKGN